MADHDGTSAGQSAPGLLVHAHGEDTTGLATAFRVARHSAEALPAGTRIQIVVQGPAVRGVVTDSAEQDDLALTLSTPEVDVVACRNSMSRVGVSETDLTAGVGSVPSAAAHLAAMQWQGWAYLRY